MHDQRVECRPPFCLKDFGTGLVIACVCAKPIDSFRGQRDQFPLFQQATSTRDPLLIRGQTGGVVLGG